MGSSVCKKTFYKYPKYIISAALMWTTSDTMWVHVDAFASLPERLACNAHDRRHDNGWQRCALEYSHRQDAMAAALGLTGESPTTYQNRL
jgi:hypothetical protein